MSGMRRVYDPRLATVGLGLSRWRGSRRSSLLLGWSSVVADEVGGGCTFFGGGLLTRGLSTCGVGELHEPYNALSSKRQYLITLSWVMIGMVVEVARGRCTLFGEGLLTHGLSTCGVGELREPYNASSA
jgi:hypothetical protein